MSTSEQTVILAEYDNCPACHTPRIYGAASFHVVCPDCGLEGDRCHFYLLSDQIFIGERIGMLRVHENGQRTRIGPYDGPAEKRGRYSLSEAHYNKINKYPNNNRTRHLHRAIKAISRIMGILGYSMAIRDQATYLYLKGYNQINQIGSVEAMAIVACYLTLRERDIPLRLKDLVPRVSNLPVERVAPFLQKYTRELKYRVKPINIAKLISRYGTDLGFPFALIRDALALYVQCNTRRLHIGRNPWVLAGGFLYLVGCANGLRTNEHFRSLKQIADVMNVSEYGVRQAKDHILGATQNA